MGDEYWGTSSVTKKVNQQKIFDIDGTNTLDRFKNRSDPLIEQILDSSRSTQVVNTTGVKSARFRSSETTTTPAAPIINNPPKSAATKIIPDTQPKITIPASQVSQTTTTPAAPIINNPPKSAATKIIPDTQPKITIPASQVSRPFDQPTEFGQKVEQTFNLTNSNVFHGSLSSLNDLPDSYYHRESGDDKYDHDDTVSLQNLPEYNPDSPKLKLRKKYAARFGRPQAATSSNDFHSNLHWQPNAEDYPDQSIKDRSTQYDKEMEMRCKDLLENKTVKLDDIREYDKKVSLLRKAVSFNTPSVTVPVMIFLENSLSRPLFYELIKQHPSAVRNYINMAKLRLENDYYIAMLKQFGRHEDVAVSKIN
ncbi:unnamed protein product [Adineta steineri]|uniref:Uncharacterized protein n=1 Tax=Adineta steineri TaxID=433720 RepID=A0A814M761_9BILA|nr:unnamed protein product [Adineta steineri]